MGKRPAEGELFDGNMGSIQREGFGLLCKEKISQPWQQDSNR
jgi:hypothetical protein